jgi:L-ascorbate metabolism protein UlaG (beta-lactamase superfamily)
MNRCGIIVLLGFMLLSGCGRHTREGPLEVTYLGNEGFMVALGSTKVLIDALASSPYYVTPTDSQVAKIENGTPPFDNISCVLVTHEHPDHFNADMMSRFLLKHPNVHFVASAETCGKLEGDSLSGFRSGGVRLERGNHETFKRGNAEITALRLDHGGYRDITNLAFCVTANGYTVVHVGDARLSENRAFLQSFPWPSSGVDILFMEYFDRGSDTQAIIDSVIRPGNLVLMHIPAGEEKEVWDAREIVHPRTIVFGNVNEMRRLDTP